MAAWVNVADQLAVRAAATLCWRMVGACLALARARLLMKAAAASSLHLPRTSIASTTKRQRWLLRRSGYVLSLLLRASSSAAPANLPARLLGWPSRVRGETRVVSTASWAPFQSGRPLAMTAIRWSSCWWGWLMLRLVLVLTRAPAMAHLEPSRAIDGLALGTK